ncbi:MAG: O-antigen ligase family protein [Kiritimatiellae bacterium]|nr:O-antigen ligase family protein [Kiritimatiellia bacterium]
MKSFYNNIVVFKIALLLGVYSWVFGGTMGPYLIPVIPWLTLILLEGMFFFPQRYEKETLQAARARVWKSLKSDALTWVIVAFIVLLTIPTINTGLCQVCDFPRIAAGEDSKPMLPFLPFCVNRIHHFGVMLWFVPSLLAVLAVKHSCLRAGKRLLIKTLVWNGFALALFGAIQEITGADAPFWGEIEGQRIHFFSTFGYSNMAGAFFTAIFALGFATWRRNIDDVNNLAKKEEHSNLSQTRNFFWKKHYLGIPTIISYFAAINSLSRATIILVTLLALLFLVHSVASMLVKLPRAKRFKLGVIAASVLALVVVISFSVMPNDVRREIDTVDAREVLDRMTGKKECHADVAMRIWKQYPVFGVGGWGYWHFRMPNMTKKEIASTLSSGAANVHNDYLQFMVEHGAVGALCLLSILILVVAPIFVQWKQLIISIRFSKERLKIPAPVHIFALPAAALFILLGVIAIMVHATGDCPLRSPAILSTLLVSLASIEGYLPSRQYE